jgi:predicted nucleotidyltransferase
MHAVFELLPGVLLDACREYYGRRLVAVAVFGSGGRGTARTDSDVDLLLVAEPLPDGRVARAAEFTAVEAALDPWVRAAQKQGLSPRFSPIFKTPSELARGTPLLLDMIDDARILLDSTGCLGLALDRVRQQLSALGARRIWMGDAWVWDLKPDYQPGDIFEL